MKIKKYFMESENQYEQKALLFYIQIKYATLVIKR